MQKEILGRGKMDLKNYSTNNKKKGEKKTTNDDLLLELIESLETVQNLTWKNFNNEKDPSERTIILEKIVELQLYIWTTYYNAKKQLFDISQYA